MGQLAISGAGAIIGNLLFPGIGGSIGFLAGSVLGNILFPPPPIINEGPRMGDLTISSSAYGAAIPWVWGTTRVAGNMIWSSGIREQENRERVGGKGGPAQYNVTYTYFSSFAIAFAATRADRVLRIWADSKLIYDDTNASSEVLEIPGLKFRFYRGTEEQLPDGLMEAKDGAGRVPAYRGLCYIVFEELALQEFGNRVPNITAEIVFRDRQSTGDTPTNQRASTDLDPPPYVGTQDVSYFGVDRSRRRIYTAEDGSGSSPGWLRIFDLDTLREVRQVELPTWAPGSQTQQNPIGPYKMGVGKYTGNIYTNIDAILSFGAYVAWNPETFQPTQVISGPSNGSMRLHQVLEVKAQNGDVWVLFIGGVAYNVTQTFLALNYTKGGLINFADQFPDNLSAVHTIAEGIEPGTVWVTLKSSGNSLVRLMKITLRGDGSALVEQEVDFPTSTWDNNAHANARVEGPFIDRADGGIILGMSPTSSSAGAKLWKYIPGVGIVWNIRLPSGQDISTGTEHWSAPTYTEITRNRLGVRSLGNQATLVDTTDGSIIFSGSFSIGTTAGACWCFDGKSQSIIYTRTPSTTSALGQIFIDRGVVEDMQLRNIIADISEAVGLDPLSDIDTSELDDMLVRGYVCSSQMTARQMIEPLAGAHFFEGVESDHVMKFPRRGKDPVATVEQRQLRRGNSGSVFSSLRAQEVELPERLTVQHLNRDADYQQGAQSARRAPGSMSSRSSQTIALPMVLTPSEAKQVAENMLFTLWNERTSHEWETGPEFLLLDPADVVEVHLDNGTQVQTRIVQSTVGANLGLGFEGLNESKTTYMSEAEADGGQGFPQRPPPGLADTRAFILDIPLLRDIDDPGTLSTLAYVGLSGYTNGWRAGTLQRSIDGATYENMTRHERAIPYGGIQNRLPDTDLPWQTDTSTVLHVIMAVGELESVSQSQFLNDMNVAAVGRGSNWEIICFRDAVEVQEGVYEVSHIMRGRRGTEYAVNGHQDGDYFVLLSPDVLEPLRTGPALLQLPLLYRPVASMQIPEAVAPFSYTLLGRSHMPLSPVRLTMTAGTSNSRVLGWTRRTRLGGELRPNTGTVPLGEATELYDLLIKNSLGEVVRTVEGLTSPTYTYTSANQTADGFAPPISELTFEVFQVSEVVGRGVGTEATLTL